MTEIHVELNELRLMAQRLRGLQEEFESLDDTVRGYDAALGDPEVAGNSRSSPATGTRSAGRSGS